MRIFETIDIRKFEDEKFLKEAISNASGFRKKKYEAMNNHIGKLQVIANTYLLDKCLNELNLKEKDMEYIVEKNGKLRFTNVDNIHFNLSHSKNMSLAVVSDVPVGCDIQYIGKVDEKLFDLVLSEEEKKFVTNKSVGGDILSPYVGADTIRPHSVEASTASLEEKFYRLWAMKEAIVKKDGTGLRSRLTDVHDDNVYIEKKVLSNNDVVESYILAII